MYWCLLRCKISVFFTGKHLIYNCLPGEMELIRVVSYLRKPLKILQLSKAASELNIIITILYLMMQLEEGACNYNLA